MRVFRKIERHKWLKESQLHLDELATELNEDEVNENHPTFLFFSIYMAIILLFIYCHFNEAVMRLYYSLILTP